MVLQDMPVTQVQVLGRILFGRDHHMDLAEVQIRGTYRVPPWDLSGDRLRRGTRPSPHTSGSSSGKSMTRGPADMNQTTSWRYKLGPRRPWRSSYGRPPPPPRIQ